MSNETAFRLPHVWWDHLGKTKRYTEEDIGEYMAINLKEVVCMPIYSCEKRNFI